jgi:CopG antitoxin of type II toxin-antitoxin system
MKNTITSPREVGQRGPGRPPIPLDQRRTSISITLPADMVRTVRAEAEARQMTVSALVQEALEGGRPR